MHMFIDRFCSYDIQAQDASINEKDVWRDHDKSTRKSMNDMNGDIEFDNVSFFYPSRQETPVLKHLSIVARAGKTTAIVGSSGCGKFICYA